MNLISVCKIYVRLLADCERLEKLKPVNEEEAALCLALKQSNAENLDVVQQYINTDFPEVCSDFDGWTAEDISLWFKFLREYPVFLKGRLRNLVFLLSSMEHSRLPKPDNRQEFIMHILMSEPMMKLFVSDDLYLQRCMEDLILKFADDEQRQAFNQKIIQMQCEI